MIVCTLGMEIVLNNVLKWVKMAEIWQKMADVKVANNFLKIAENDLKPKVTENGKIQKLEFPA